MRSHYAPTHPSGWMMNFAENTFDSCHHVSCVYGPEGNANPNKLFKQNFFLSLLTQICVAAATKIRWPNCMEGVRRVLIISAKYWFWHTLSCAWATWARYEFSLFSTRMNGGVCCWNLNLPIGEMSPKLMLHTNVVDDKKAKTTRMEFIVVDFRFSLSVVKWN